MDKDSIFFYILIGFVLLICLKIYSESDAYNLKCIISSVDGERYCVRERAKLELAADLLAKVTNKCKELVIYQTSRPVVHSTYKRNQHLKISYRNMS